MNFFTYIKESISYNSVYLILAHVKNFVRKLKFNNEIETTGTDQTMSWNSVQHDENALKHQQHGCLLIYLDLMLSMLLSIYGCGTDQTMSWNSGDLVTVGGAPCSMMRMPSSTSGSACLLIYLDLMVSMLLSIYGCGTDQTMSWNSGDLVTVGGAPCSMMRMPSSTSGSACSAERLVASTSHR